MKTRSIYLLNIVIAVSLNSGATPKYTHRRPDKKNSKHISYAIVVSTKTLSTPGWKNVITSLEEKYPESSHLTYINTPKEALPLLKQIHPRHTCFVARPDEAGRDFVLTLHQICRSYDSDPYTDTLWSILTGYNASNALQIAKHNKPLIIRKVASGTAIALEMIEQGGWYDEGIPGRKVWKNCGGKPIETRVPQDTTKALVDTLNKWHADCFITSGHATERNWQIGYAYKNGYFKCENGKLYGEDINKKRYPVNSSTPKVYLPIGNCLMGHIDCRDAMALAWMNSAGVKQMIGYTHPTWFGYAGWGTLDYFVEQPGRYTLIEAFFANNHALIHKLATNPTSKGLMYDRDHIAVYGDPAWSAKMAAGPCYWSQSLQKDNDTFTLTITPLRGKESFMTVNTNGSQRGVRPVVVYLPYRCSEKAEITEGTKYKPVITDDFILVPNPGKAYNGEQIVIRFRFIPTPPAI